jgi:hypothetical protein
VPGQVTRVPQHARHRDFSPDGSYGTAGAPDASTSSGKDDEFVVVP